MGADDLLLFGDAGAQRGDQGALPGRGPRHRGQTGGIGGRAVYHRPRARPPGTISSGRVAQLPTQIAVDAGRPIQGHGGIGCKTAVLDRQRTRQRCYLLLTAAHHLARGSQTRTGIQRRSPTRHRRIPEQRMCPTQHLPHLLNQRTDRHTTSIRPPAPSSAHKIVRPHMGFDAVRPCRRHFIPASPMLPTQSCAWGCLCAPIRFTA